MSTRPDGAVSPFVSLPTSEFAGASTHAVAAGSRRPGGDIFRGRQLMAAPAIVAGGLPSAWIVANDWTAICPWRLAAGGGDFGGARLLVETALLADGCPVAVQVLSNDFTKLPWGR